MIEFNVQKQRTIISILIFIFGVLLQLILQQWFRPYALENLYFFPLYPSSETMMQTVSIEDLRDRPIESLWNIHIQPPAFDSIRAVLANFWALADPNSYQGQENLLALLHKVDQSLYFLWALFYGILGVIIFRWLADTTPIKFAAICSIIFLLHPATIFYATFLDSTFISAFLITWMFYLIWKQQTNPLRPINYLIFAVLALFFTRSIFQWPFIIVLTLSLAIIRIPIRRIATFALICSTIIFAYLGKQYSQFGIFSTSSFTGYNLTKSIDMRISQAYWSKFPDNTKFKNPNLPTVLTRERKLLGDRNFNNMFYLELNQKLTGKYKELIGRADPRKLLSNYLDNTKGYFLPSSRYGKHVIVDHLLWRNVYDHIFSSPILPSLLLLAGIYWFIKTNPREYIRGAALLLPALYIFLTSVLLEKGENLRFKFFLEPVLFVFIANQLHSIWKKVQGKTILNQGWKNEI